MSKQLPPVRVTPEKLQDIEKRAKECELSLTEYIRYRCFGKNVLTGEQLARVKSSGEKLVD